MSDPMTADPHAALSARLREPLNIAGGSSPPTGAISVFPYHDPIRIEAADAIDALRAEVERLTVELRRSPMQGAQEYSARSWNGFNVYGDRKSIDEVARIDHGAYTAEVFRKEVIDGRDTISTLTAAAEADRAEIVRLRDALFNMENSCAQFAVSQVPYAVRAAARAALEPRS